MSRSAPATISDVINELKLYHVARRRRYDELLHEGDNSRTSLLLRELVKLEQQSIQIIDGEQHDLGPKEKTRLLKGPGLTHKSPHAVHCRCDSNPTFDDAVECALTPNDAVDELINRIEGATAAGSIQELARRLRELEGIKQRQISKYLRED